jgi:hypothetical protein
MLAGCPQNDSFLGRPDGDALKRALTCAERRAERAPPLHRMLVTAVWYHAEHGGH